MKRGQRLFDAHPLTSWDQLWRKHQFQNSRKCVCVCVTRGEEPLTETYWGSSSWRSAARPPPPPWEGRDRVYLLERLELNTTVHRSQVDAPDPVLVQTLHDGVPVVDDLHQFGHQFFFSLLVPGCFQVFCSHRATVTFTTLCVSCVHPSPTWFFHEPPELLLHTGLLFFQLLGPAAVQGNTAAPTLILFCDFKLFWCFNTLWVFKVVLFIYFIKMFFFEEQKFL